MTYSLVIVESPAKCSKIEKFLGPGYKCLASFGHLTKLSSLKNIDIENNFSLKFSIIEEKANTIQKLQKAINSANDVILATEKVKRSRGIFVNYLIYQFQILNEFFLMKLQKPLLKIV